MARGRHDERLWAPLRWWVLAGGLVVSVWVAVAAPLGTTVAAAAAAVAAALSATVLVGVGSLRVAVDDDGLRAGDAVLPSWAVGGVEALRGADARAARGPGSGPADHLVIRGYVDGVVRVAVADPDDPVEHWVVSSRRPESLAAALTALRDRRD